MQLITTAAGTFFKKAVDSDVLTSVAIPTGVTSRGFRTSFVRTRRASILNGRFDPGLVWFDHVQQLRKLGMREPATSPQATTPTTGTGNIDGNVIYYYSFLEISGTSELHESSISAGSNLLLVTNNTATVNSLPDSTTALAREPRTTHLRIYRSDDGDVPKRVGDMAISAATTFLDNVASDARGIEVPVHADGSVIADARTVPGFARLVQHYHRRVVYAGFEDNPHRVKISLQDEPESAPPINDKDTLGREAVTAIATYRDQIIIFCSNVIYEIQGYDEDDFVMRKLVDGIGCIAPHSVAYDDWGRVWFMTQVGAFMYDGSFHHMMRDMAGFIRAEYEASPTVYENCVGYIDKRWKSYNIQLPSSYTHVGAWGHLDPAAQLEAGNDQPAWSFDITTRLYTAAGVLVEGENQEQVYLGSSTGSLYRANIDADGDDAGDTNLKNVVIVPGHNYTGDQAHGFARGSTITDLTLYLKSDQSYNVSIYSGSDKVYEEAAAPTWGPYQFPATVIAGKVSEVAKHIRPRLTSGKGHTPEISVANAVDFEYRGYSIQSGAGPHSVSGT